MSAEPLLVRIADVGLDDIALVGGKGANLGVLTRLALQVPAGFVVTTAAYAAAMRDGGARDALRSDFEGACACADDPVALDVAARRLQSLVRRAGVPADLRAEISAACRGFGPGTRFAVRSSAPAEDAGDTSFAGMHESFVNVVDEGEVLQHVVDCWASIFSPRVIAYRVAHGIRSTPDIAVVIQESVSAERSGVMFTADPVTGDRSSVVIEAARGFGEVVVGGAVAPDRYVLAKSDLTLTGVAIGSQSMRLVENDAGGVTTTSMGDDGGHRVLTDDEAVSIAQLGLTIESWYRRPMDVEWALAGGELYALQARPITTLAPSAAPGHVKTGPGEGVASGQLLVEGVGAAPGAASGRVRVVGTLEEAAQLVAGEVLVAEMTTPDWVPAIRRAAAMVTDQGGLTCHAAIVARELGVPCVVGTQDATTALRDGTEVTVDGSRGTVTAGLAAPPPAPDLQAAPGGRAEPSTSWAPPTATRILVNLALADDVERIAARSVDGVGLLRAELLVTDALGGVHPKRLLADGSRDDLVKRWSEPVIRIGRAFGARPVIYRAIDFRTNEFRGLVDGQTYEPIERNPMIGYRGCYRYIRDPELFAVELEVVARIRSAAPNVHLMIPFVRTRWELEACFDAIDASPLGRDGHLQRWIMAEVPSVAYWLPTYASMGVAGVSIGSNDLTQLVLGVDRDSATCAELFDEEDGAVLDAIERIIIECREAGVASSLCGQAPANRPGFVDRLVRFGIGSVSVDPSAVDDVQRAVQRAESALLLESARHGIAGLR